MTLMMVAPMAAVMLLSMRSMFSVVRNRMIIGAAVAVFALSYIAMRQQTAVGDGSLRSMIPHIPAPS